MRNRRFWFVLAGNDQLAATMVIKDSMIEFIIKRITINCCQTQMLCFSKHAKWTYINHNTMSIAIDRHGGTIQKLNFKVKCKNMDGLIIMWVYLQSSAFPTHVLEAFGYLFCSFCKWSPKSKAELCIVIIISIIIDNK